MKSIILLILFILLLGCNSNKDNSPLGKTGEKLVILTLEAGTLDEDLVDSYIGDLTIDSSKTYTAEGLKKDFSELMSEINNIQTNNRDLNFRKKYQLAIAKAIYTRLRILNNENVKFLDECKSIYQVTPEFHSFQYYDSLLTVLDSMLDGEGDIRERFANYREKFKIEYKQVNEAFQKSIQTAAQITKEHIQLPDSESVRIEYLDGAPWSAYNWYKGNYKSLIQLNKLADIYIERVFDIAAHESYPGHHVYYSLREKEYYRDKGYVEFSIYPLFSPVSLLAEGTAEYANELIFPEKEKIEFLRTKISYKSKYTEQELKDYFKVLDIVNKLDEVVINISKEYLNNEISAKETISLLEKYGLESESGALRKLDFINKYRSYIINYPIGKSLITKYIKLKAGDDINKKWQVYKDILEKPYLPNDLISQIKNMAIK